MENRSIIRLINESDAQNALNIYTPYVLNTSISFEYDIPSIEDFLHRIKGSITEFPWLVCERDRQVLGFAYAGKHRYRTGYQWSTESTIYLSHEAHGSGIARILYETLFSILNLQGYLNVFACVIQPNEKSVAFHRAMGFEEIGMFKKVGYKLENWHDSIWFQLILNKHNSNPSLPKSLIEIIASPDFIKIMMDANERLNQIRYVKDNGISHNSVPTSHCPVV